MVKFEKVDDWYEEKTKKWKFVLIIVGIVVLAGAGVTFYFLQGESRNLVKKESSFIKKEEEKEEKAEPTSNTIMIDIKGQIQHPGTYQIKEGSRIQDAIQISGGLTGNADTSLLNLSKKLQDEMVIIIYSKEQVKNIKETVLLENKLLTECPKIEENITNDGCTDKESKEPSAKEEESSTKVSLNKATLEDLMTLSGIGEAKAKQILEYRQTKGGFTSIEELKEVAGIGESIFAKIKEDITL